MTNFPLQAQGVPADVLVMLVLDGADAQDAPAQPAVAPGPPDQTTDTCPAGPTPQPSPFFPMQLHLVRALCQSSFFAVWAGSWLKQTVPGSADSGCISQLDAQTETFCWQDL